MAVRDGLRELYGSRGGAVHYDRFRPGPRLSLPEPKFNSSSLARIPHQHDNGVPKKRVLSATLGWRPHLSDSVRIIAGNTGIAKSEAEVTHYGLTPELVCYEPAPCEWHDCVALPELGYDGLRPARARPKMNSSTRCCWLSREA
ncbi:hypothetical protein Pmar_PMAR025670 [Perkinsus marinus ATCC 50983]|uniref:Uncharacterized protein n=1 Tax=Perkinsus marinus (strain ATCC 50983 / TXsc) TaxID=423536 RepID=C5KIP3_PERM5|nr:hypothetical protein Pmar_PMAR025670 [Perkinsus marinus ATCC 50983]EER15657.1 hypothetical protein Pmar_PMAR025670 [Perkinsus marinus ATCC 50983]|eukprot:XP_002783861.1 hypothetical protein Pmar_PMAR025670 [Perkinsus marinus ATCC 50983]